MLILCSLLKISGCILRNVYSAVVPVFWGPTTRKDGSLWQLLLRFQIFIWRASKQGFYPQRDQSLECSSQDYRELKRPQRQRQQQHHKQLVLWAKQPCMCITHFSTFLRCPLHNYDVKPPSVTFYEGCCEHTSTKFPFSSGVNSRRNCLHLTNIDKVWKDTNSSFAMFSLPSSSWCAAILAFCS